MNTRAIRDAPAVGEFDAWARRAHDARPDAERSDELQASAVFARTPNDPESVITPRTATSRPASTVVGELPHSDLVAAIPRLRRYARVLTGNATRADDLVQDTLLRAWDKRGLWHVGSDLRAWLFTIMHNVYVNQRVLARREAGTVSLDSDEHGAAWQIADNGNQLDRIELRELAQQVDRLPAEQRDVLLLVVVEGLRYKDIAETLAIPLGTVMSRLSRARDNLRRMAVEPPLRSR